MGAITLSVPNELKHEMDKVDWINWSSIARRAFVTALKDTIRLEAIKKAREISEIKDDERNFNKEYEKELLKITKGSRGKVQTVEGFNKWCESI
jgi:hypothetical protein